MEDVSPSQDELESTRMPVWEHLDELRRRLIRCLLAVSVVTVFTYSFAEDVVRFLEEPVLQALPAENAYLYFTGVADKFVAYLKVSVVAAITLVSPYLLYEVWLFVAPALYRHERNRVWPFLLFGSLAFVAGGAFAFFGILPQAYRFLLNFGSAHERPIITLSEYISLTLKLMLTIGLVFQVPVLMALLARFGIVSSAGLARFRKHALVASAVGAAVLTPTPDAFTMLLVMVPLWLLYEAGIAIVRFLEPGVMDGEAVG